MLYSDAFSNASPIDPSIEFRTCYRPSLTRPSSFAHCIVHRVSNESLNQIDNDCPDCHQLEFSCQSGSRAWGPGRPGSFRGGRQWRGRCERRCTCPRAASLVLEWDQLYLCTTAWRHSQDSASGTITGISARLRRCGRTILLPSKSEPVECRRGSWWIIS